MASDSVTAKLYNDQVFAACRTQRMAETNSNSDVSANDQSAEFTCVYTMHDYRAAELLGEALVARGKPLDEKTLYMLARAFYLRGNTPKALRYAKLGYSHIDDADKARCKQNRNRCEDFRQLLVTIDSSYRAKFAAEDAQIAAEAAAAARAAAAVALDISGSGIHSTEIFTVNGEWELDWSYDCTSFGGQGNFIVTVFGADGEMTSMGVNQLGDLDSGTEFFHQGGDIYLEINSECDWTVKAVNE